MTMVFRYPLSVLACMVMIVLPVAVHAQQSDNTTPPQVLDIDDPFSRDLKRAAEDATGGILFDDGAIGIEEEEESGRDLLGRESRIAVNASNFRVMGVAVSRQQTSNQIFVHFKEETVAGAKPLLNYLRIGTHPSLDDARQQAINLKSSFNPYLDASLIIREAEDTDVVDLDIGPFREISHAERYCDMLLNITFGLVNDCYVVQEFPGIEPIESFQSTAMLRFSSDAVSSVIEDTSVFDLPGAAGQAFNIREGDSLGSGSTVAVKVLPAGVVVVDEVGSIATLPLTFIPEDVFTEQEGGGAISLPSIPVDAGEGTGGEDIVEEEDSPTAAELLLPPEDN